MGLLEKGRKEGRQKGSRERPGAPVPVAPALAASCHQEIGNTANEEGHSGNRSDDDDSHNPSAHGQVCHGQLRVLF